MFKDMKLDQEEKFCIGPIADYMFWYGSRAGMQMDRGPWSSPVDFMRATAQREITWTQQLGRPMEPEFPHNALGRGKQESDDYIKLLESNQNLVPHLLHKDPVHPRNLPNLRHPDPTPGNIYIDPKTGEISCLINWQHAVVQPNLLAAGYPRAFENPDSEIPSDIQEPHLPDDIASLSSAEQSIAHELHRRRLAFYYYHIFNGHVNKPHIDAMRDPLLFGRQLLVDQASRQWSGNLDTLKGAIVRATQYWSHLPDTDGVMCPIHFDEAELQSFSKSKEEWLKMSMTQSEWFERVGMTEDGWVSHDDYEGAKRRLAELEEDYKGQCEGDEEDLEWMRTGWPFRDREELH